MSNQFILKVRRERTDQTPTSLEFGEIKYTELDGRLHIGNHDGSVTSFGPISQITWAQIVNKPATFSGLNLPLQLSDIPAGIDYATLQNRPDISALDDVVDYPDLASFPATGETGKLYIALDTGLFYRWAASQYVQLTGKAATWGEIVGSLSAQADLAAALGAKAAAATVPRYVALSPRHQEWNNLSVSTGGQNYTLSSIPQTGNVLVQYMVNPGLAASNTNLSIILEPPSIIKTPPAGGTLFSGFVGDAGSRVASSGAVQSLAIAGQGQVLAENGQIWAQRNGTYNSTSQQTDLWVLGYWTNPTA